VTGTVERAYQLAGSGNCVSLKEIRARLAAEGCSGIRNHLAGPVIRRALTALCMASR
jgi:hypothetical protein